MFLICSYLLAAFRELPGARSLFRPSCQVLVHLQSNCLHLDKGRDVVSSDGKLVLDAVGESFTVALALVVSGEPSPSSHRVELSSVLLDRAKSVRGLAKLDQLSSGCLLVVYAQKWALNAFSNAVTSGQGAVVAAVMMCGPAQLAASPVRRFKMTIQTRCAVTPAVAATP